MDEFLIPRAHDSLTSLLDELNRSVPKYFCWSIPKYSIFQELSERGITLHEETIRISNSCSVLIFLSYHLLNTDYFIALCLVPTGFTRPNIASFSFQNVFFYLYWANDTLMTNGRPVSGSRDLSRPIRGQDYYLLTMYKTRRLAKIHRHGSR